MSEKIKVVWYADPKDVEQLDQIAKSIGADRGTVLSSLLTINSPPRQVLELLDEEERQAELEKDALIIRRGTRRKRGLFDIFRSIFSGRY